MDSSELTKFRRNRIEANSYNGQKITNAPNKITQMSASSALSIFLGGKKVMFNKRTILPNCQGPSCIIDQGTEPEPQPEPPITESGWVTNILGSVDTSAQSVTVDKNNGNFIYVTGNFSGTLELKNYLNVTSENINTSPFGSINVSTSEKLEYIAKYDTNGDAVWATYIKIINAGQNEAKARSIKTDSDGNVYVTLDIGFDVGVGVPECSIEFYNFDNLDNLTSEIITSLAGTLTLPSSVTNGSDSDSDIILVKYNGTTGQVQWVTSIGSINSEPAPSENEFESSLTIDSLNNIYVSGSFRNTTLINSAVPLLTTPTPITVTPYATLQPPETQTQTNRNIGFIAKYDVNGQALRATLIGGGGGAGGHNTTITCIDSDGTDIYVSGVSLIATISLSESLKFYSFNGLTINPPAPASINLTESGNRPDYTNIQPFLAKYDVDLEFKWALRLDGTADNTGQVTSVSTSSDGVYITGFYSTPSLAVYKILSTDIDSTVLGILPPNITFTGFIIKYSKLNGALLWATTFLSTTQNSQGLSLAIDSDNNVIVTGLTDSQIMTINSYDGISSPPSPPNIQLASFGTLSTVNNVRKVFIIKYNGTGQVQWATYLDENLSNSFTPNSFSISTDSSDAIIICGKYSNPLVFRNYQPTSPSTGPINTMVYGTLPILPGSEGSTAYLAKYDKTGMIV